MFLNYKNVSQLNKNIKIKMRLKTTEKNKNITDKNIYICKKNGFSLNGYYSPFKYGVSCYKYSRRLIY